MYVLSHPVVVNISDRVLRDIPSRLSRDPNGSAVAWKSPMMLDAAQFQTKWVPAFDSIIYLPNTQLVLAKGLHTGFL